MRGRPGDQAVNAIRMAVGTLTVLPVRAPAVDRVTAGRAMVLAPAVGLLLWLPVAALLQVADDAGLSPLLTAALSIGVLALLTRAMHLDGLADTADGLGSGRPALEALEVMRRGDVGPFGAVTLLLTLLVQVTALGQLVATGGDAIGVGAALVVSRLALPLACLRGVPAARRDGLGSAVAGSVPRPLALVAVALAFAPGLVLVGLGFAVGLEVVVVAPLGLLAGLAVGWRAVHRLGGITGDVLGAVVEATFTASLVALCVA